MMRRFAALLTALALLPYATTAGSPAALPAAPDRIEEDWLLVIGEPDVQADGPQMTTTMSPVGDNSQVYAAFNLNYHEEPFQAGGLEIQVREQELLIVKDSDKTQQCATANETVTWTQSMRLSNGTITYAVDNGRSQTWGQFGEDNNLDVQFSSGLVDLSGYNPAVSIANSGAGWQPNHVTSMRIVQVRYYAGGTLIATDTTPKDVDLTR